jgi:hypothetical protein
VTATPGPSSGVERPGDGEVYVWLVGNFEWLEQTEKLVRAAFPQGATVEQRTAFEVAMHRFSVQLVSLSRMKNLYAALSSDEEAAGT